MRKSYFITNIVAFRYPPFLTSQDKETVIMFWTQCDKIVTSGGPVKCDFCPCPKYIYVTRCDKTENDFDDCDCNPETAWERARLVTYFASENGCINVDGAWRRLNHTYYPADGSEFSANGSVYKAIETGENGPKTYDTRPKAQTEWDAHPKSYWGEKVIAACTCCCLLDAEYTAEFNLQTYSYSQMWTQASEPVVISTAESTNYLNSQGAGAEVEFNTRAKTARIAQYHERSEYKCTWGNATSPADDWQCEIDQTEGNVTLQLALSENCDKLLLTGLNIRTESVYENRCGVASHDSDWLDKVLDDGGSYPEIPFSGYAEGTFQLNFSKTTHQDLDTYTSSLNGQITLRRKSKSLPPAAYRAVYEQLDPSLK